jgi:lysophospholipid acyltransferase (LPLAT)-like uncharacterized protein
VIDPGNPPIRPVSVVKDVQVAGLAHYLTALRRTSHVSVVRASEGSALLTFWHDAILALLAATSGTENVAIYVRDQPFIEDTLDLLAYLGLPTFVSNHQGTAGIKAARKWLAVPGRLLVVTADPEQPRVAVPGVARLARMLGVPLCPLAVTASRGSRLRRTDGCVLPQLGGELTVRALPPVNEPSPEASAAAVQRALSSGTLLETAARPLLPWRRVLEAWPRLCLKPRTRGQVTVWPATEPASIIF